MAARAPRKLAFTHDEALKFCGQWRAFTVLAPTLQLFDAALDVCNRYQIGYYDAAILAAARQLGCLKVHSEDLNDGQDYDGVRVENPFTESRAPRSPDVPGPHGRCSCQRRLRSYGSSHEWTRARRPAATTRGWPTSGPMIEVARRIGFNALR